jgi:hypothetical protein
MVEVLGVPDGAEPEVPKAVKGVSPVAVDVVGLVDVVGVVVVRAGHVV